MSHHTMVGRLFIVRFFSEEIVEKGGHNKLNHFSDEAWIDFVRQTIAAQRRVTIQQHLDEGCAECVRAHGVWRAVADFMARGEQVEIPEETTQAGIALFDDWRRRYVIPKRARLARLIYDSYREPLMAGVRGGGPPARRCLHRTGQWSIDTRLEIEPSGRLMLDGQLLKSEMRHPADEKIEVFLIGSGKVVAAASLNPFGEFQVLCQPEPALRAYFEIPGELPIAIALPNPPGRPS